MTKSFGTLYPVKFPFNLRITEVEEEELLKTIEAQMITQEKILSKTYETYKHNING